MWAWSRSLFGEAVALISVLVFIMLPPILGHAGLATNDMAATATCAAALYAFVRSLDKPGLANSLILGFTLALAVLAKFTALLSLPACGFALLAWRWWCGRGVSNPAPVGGKQRVMTVVLVAVTAGVVIWAGYRF